MLQNTHPDVKLTLQCAEAPPLQAPRALRRQLASRLQASLMDFLRWQRQHRDLSAMLDTVPDARDPARTRIPLPALLLAVLCLFWLGLKSLHALDDHLRHRPHLRRVLALAGWNGSIADDTFAEVLNRLDWTVLRSFLHRQGRRELKHWGACRYLESELGTRLKAVGAAHLAAKAIVALDGHELFVSEKRCCADCLVREASKKRDGELVKVREYYHAAVFAQWVGAHPAPVLDFEPIAPGEGELTAAYRLVERLGQTYGDKIGILTGDGLYDCEPIRFLAQQAGYHTVIRQKREDREPGKSARKSLGQQDPDRERPDRRHREGPRRYACWDVPVDGRRYVEVHRRVGDKTQVGGCLTSLPARQAPAIAVAMIMETRWWIENTGFHELSGAWSFDRAFVHAGRPAAAWAFVALALTAFNAFQAYVYRNLKLDPRRPERSLAALRRDLFETLADFARSRRPQARAP